jgi:hypothetical protein
LSINPASFSEVPKRPDYIAWTEQQVALKGPTAREAAFVHVIDLAGPRGGTTLLHAGIRTDSRLMTGDPVVVVD